MAPTLPRQVYRSVTASRFRFQLRVLGKGCDSVDRLSAFGIRLAIVLAATFITLFGTGCQSPLWIGPRRTPAAPLRTVPAAVTKAHSPSPNNATSPPNTIQLAQWQDIGSPENEPTLALSEDQNPQTLTEDEVAQVVRESFPLAWSAWQEQEIAAGILTASRGAYDLQLTAATISRPLGFYQNHRHAIGVSQLNAWNGSRWFGGYRLGDGRFPTWYGDRLTNDGGELAIGASIPLLQNRMVDPQRTRWYKAEQQLLAAEPLIRQQLNVYIRDATAAYWNWVSAGLSRKVQRQLLELAQERARQIERRVQQGDLPELSLIDNDRLIAQREAAVIDAEQRFQASTIQLSLYLRDATGRPVLASEQRLPAMFPELQLPVELANEELARQLILAHPTLAVADLQIQQQQVEIQQARNLALPKFDLFWETSQDLGATSTITRDKSPFELETGLIADVPLQRREAVGQLAVARARLEQLQWQRRFLEETLFAALQEHSTAMENARQRFQRAQANVRLAEQALDIGRRAFLAGDIDLIVLNIYEQSLADAELLQIDAQRAFFVALVEYRLALGAAED